LGYSIGRSAGPPLILLVVLYLIGWLWRWYAITHGLLYGTLLGTSQDVTSYSNALAVLSNFSSVAFIGLLVFSPKIRPVLFLLLPELIWKWLGTSKAGPVYVLLPVLAICYARGFFRINMRFLLTALVIAALFLASFVVIHEYRVESQKMILSDGLGSFSPLSALASMSVDSQSFEEIGDRLSQRLAWSEGFGNTLIGKELWRHASLSEGSYQMCLLWVVPRALWPDKPSTSLGAWYGHHYLGWPLSSRSEGEISLWGEAYLNGGLLLSVLLPAAWLFMMQMIYLACLRLRAWGLLLLGIMYIVLINSLAVNLAVTVAALGQSVVLLLILFLATSFLNSLRTPVAGSGA